MHLRAWLQGIIQSDQQALTTLCLKSLGVACESYVCYLCYNIVWMHFLDLQQFDLWLLQPFNTINGDFNTCTNIIAIITQNYYMLKSEKLILTPT